MRVLLVNHTFDRSEGQGKVNAEVARALLDRGHDATLVSADRPDQVVGLDGADVRTVTPVRWAPSRLLRHLTFGYRTAKLIRRLRPEHDLVIANGGMTFARTDINLCHFVHRSWLRNPQHPLRRQRRTERLWSLYQYAYSKQAEVWERNAYLRAERVIAISELIRDQLVNDVGVDPKRVTVIENGLDALSPSGTHTLRADARSLFRVTDEQTVVFFVAELRTPRKNFDTLIRALKHLPESVVVVAAGEHRSGPYPEIVKRAGLEDRVRFLGFRKDIRNLYPGADVFTLVSHYEPFGLVVTEAMASGVPVVAASTVGAAQVVTRYNAGIVIEDATDEHTFAEAIGRLHTDASLRAKYGENGRVAADELAWTKVGERYESLLRSVVEQRGERAEKQR